MKTPLTPWAILAGLGLTAIPLTAGVESEISPVVEYEPATGSDWEISLAPFLWTAGVDGVVGVVGVGEFVAPVDMDFSDIWDNLDLVLLVSAEVRKGRWGLLTNLTWLQLSSEQNGGGVLYNSIDVELTQTILDARLTYRLCEGQTTADLMAGARYMSVDTEIDFVGGRFDQRRRDVDIDADWIDPLEEDPHQVREPEHCQEELTSP